RVLTMRWALAKVAIATTLMVAVAFYIPLAMVIAQMAEERAMASARESASSMVTVLAATEDTTAIKRAVAADMAGAQHRMAVHLGDQPVIGATHVSADTVTAA